RSYFPGRDIGVILSALEQQVVHDGVVLKARFVRHADYFRGDEVARLSHGKIRLSGHDQAERRKEVYRDDEFELIVLIRYNLAEVNGASILGDSPQYVCEILGS